MSDHVPVAAGADAPKPRLMIQKLTLNNFKSYAGVKSIGPFDKRFSAVVGPNGSGKSNVIDALQFCLGRRATKLRLKKISQLIHSSTEYPDCQSCSVTVHFQMIIDTDDDADGPGFVVVEGSEFTISREATKDNKSRYFIDKTACSGKEVIDLLRGKGMDLDNNRFLILQGEVEQIALMKPKAQTPSDVGLLEYLEDLIGSNVYVEPIEAQAEEVRKHDEERTFALNKVVMIEKAKDELEGAKVEAEAYLQKERALCRLNATAAQIFIRDTRAASAKTRAEYDTMVANRAHEETRMAEKEAVCAETKKQYEKVAEEHEVIAKAVEEYAKGWAAFERKDVKLRENLKNAKQQVRQWATASMGGERVDLVEAVLLLAWWWWWWWCGT